MINCLSQSTPVGKITIIADEKAVISLIFGRDSTYPEKPTPLLRIAFIQLAEYFEGKRKVFSVPLEPKGKEFQQKIWKLLCDIPYGRTRSYNEIARAAGNPDASRAVGTAIGKNPIPIFIPCHRVVAYDGGIGGFSAGADTKKRLLNIEEQNSNYIRYGNKELNYLKARDPALKDAITEIGTVDYEIIPDLFSALVNSIIAQQISTKALATVWQRMELLCGEITPERVNELTIIDLRSIGISERKARYIKSAAEKILNKEIDFEKVKKMNETDMTDYLCRLDGVGKWTVEMLLIFSLERRDILSYDDMGIRRGLCKLHSLESLTEDEFKNYKELYSPYGTIASLYLWNVK